MHTKCTKTLMDKLRNSMFTLQKGSKRRSLAKLSCQCRISAFRHGVLQQRDHFLVLLHGCPALKRQADAIDICQALDLGNP